MSNHLTPGTVIETPYGLATITAKPAKPDEAGVIEIEYAGGDVAGLDTLTEQFLVAEPK